SGIKVIPNPVNPLVENIITIRYNLMPGAKVTVKAYNIAGELVKGMEDYAGIGQVKWQLDAKVAPGIYILVINAGTDSGMRKTMVEKLAIFYK
ncbi:MAG TPA: T9SS type A sorting domain-containing protein, partial [Candidatus Goldiibacteriota bacterium]|nr:T9SS type A sorting domain-containing protein [Candidatus Goldiibacteriota bacterium]